MNTQLRAEAITQTSALEFTQGKGVEIADVKKFCTVVNQDAREVSLGIVAELKKQGVQAQAKALLADHWLIQVGTPRSEPHESLMADPNIAANITITANTSDIPATIDALNNFFGNWRAVVGLIATGAAVVAGRWLMTVQRRP